jgi:hypothetical protein
MKRLAAWLLTHSIRLVLGFTQRRSAPIRPDMPSCRPVLQFLEDRLMPGDGVGGFFATALVLPSSDPLARIEAALGMTEGLVVAPRPSLSRSRPALERTEAPEGSHGALHNWIFTPPPWRHSARRAGAAGAVQAA